MTKSALARSWFLCCKHTAARNMQSDFLLLLKNFTLMPLFQPCEDRKCITNGLIVFLSLIVSSTSFEMCAV